MLDWLFRHTYTSAPYGLIAGRSEHRRERQRLEQSRPSCAISGNRSDETSSRFAVPAERCARDLKLADTMNCASALRHTGSHERGIGEVRKPTRESHAAFRQSEHRTQTIFLLREGEQGAQPPGVWTFSIGGW